MTSTVVYGVLLVGLVYAASRSFGQESDRSGHYEDLFPSSSPYVDVAQAIIDPANDPTGVHFDFSDPIGPLDSSSGD